MPTVNGLAFSPDEKYLYVNAGRDNYVNRYEVRADGTLANGKLFIDMRKETEGIYIPFSIYQDMFGRANAISYMLAKAVEPEKSVDAEDEAGQPTGKETTLC